MRNRDRAARPIRYEPDKRTAVKLGDWAMGNHETYMVPAGDGRQLETLVCGPPDGFPLVFHHWTPGAAVPFGILERPATRRGARVIYYSRPGCGLSTPRPESGTTTVVADAGADTAAILDHLGLSEFVTIGWSGGGPSPLACAALMPERCRAVACLASPGPHDAEGLDPLAGMTAANITEYTAAGQGKEALTANLEQFTAPMLGLNDDQLVEALRGMFGPALSGELGDYAVSCVRHSVRQGVIGWRDDTLAQVQPWGFDLDQIRVPVSIWHGADDRNVGTEHAEWLRQHIPGAQLHIIEGEGHVSLILRIDEVLDDLLQRAGLTARR